MSLSSKNLWNRATSVIPGGNHLLSKRPDMFIPDGWPTYYQKAKGCYIWDLDGNKYIDFSIMGIGTNILGYAHDEIDNSVMLAVENSNMSTLNCPEEVLLAEKLIQMHTWADMARFSRSGGEANAIAIRIARAATGKDKVAVCGYHGWHDWYLAANMTATDSLAGHLLPGLNTSGVPKGLENTVYTFEYNNINMLENLLRTHDIGVIKMEVQRNYEPESNFLASVRNLADMYNCVLIFDECTSGFRETFGGLHKKYSVYPDLAMFGKALGNGYAITAVIGKREIMKFAEETFMSSTFWTERIGPTAALKTLEVMEREQSWNIITNRGKYIAKRWKELAKKYGLTIEVFGLDALIKFKFLSKDNNKYKTFITHQLLKNNILASNAIYVSVAHTPALLDEYFYHLEDVFKVLESCENGQDIDSLLPKGEASTGFRRLN